MLTQPQIKGSPQRSIRPCPLCSNRTSHHLTHLEYALFDDNPLTPVMPLNSCAFCGFLFYDTSSTGPDFDLFYENHYLIHAYYSSAHDYQADKKTYQHLSELIKTIGINENSRIIDVGCGQGQLMRSLISYGFKNLAGVDLFSEYIKDLNSEGFEAYIGSAVNLPEEIKNADLLIYKHIFEHFFDLHSAAKSACDAIAPGGYLLIAVPDALRYNDFQDYSFLHYMNLEHINHFDRHHIESLFLCHGMKLESATTIMLDISEDYPVPIMSCLFRKPIMPVVSEITPEFKLAKKMQLWLEDDTTIDTIELKNLASNQKPVYVWGISFRTALYLGMSSLRACNIKAFLDIDTRKQNKTLWGKKIVSPDMIKLCTKDDTIVIGVGPSSRSMANMLDKLGFRGEVIRLL